MCCNTKKRRGKKRERERTTSLPHKVKEHNKRISLQCAKWLREIVFCERENPLRVESPRIVLFFTRKVEISTALHICLHNNTLQCEFSSASLVSMRGFSKCNKANNLQTSTAELYEEKMKTCFLHNHQVFMLFLCTLICCLSMCCLLMKVVNFGRLQFEVQRC